MASIFPSFFGLLCINSQRAVLVTIPIWIPHKVLRQVILGDIGVGMTGPLGLRRIWATLPECLWRRSLYSQLLPAAVSLAPILLLRLFKWVQFRGILTCCQHENPEFL